MLIIDTGTVGAQLFDMSRKLRARKLFQCSYAFIQELEPGKEKAFSYPLYYLHNSTVLQNDNWASTTRPPVVRLDWLIGSKNCSTARLNSNAYACRDDKSDCVDVGAPGYQCSCQEGYSGNPYLPGGCKCKTFNALFFNFQIIKWFFKRLEAIYTYSVTFELCVV